MSCCEIAITHVSEVVSKMNTSHNEKQRTYAYFLTTSSSICKPDNTPKRHMRVCMTDFPGSDRSAFESLKLS